MNMYPFKFEPIYKHRIWGGRKLEDVFDKKLPADQKIGESWELADLPEDKSVLANGTLAGQTLAGAIKKYPKEIVGDSGFTGPFPLLIKLLDAQDVLSVQVHPDPETCRRTGKGDPKTECWYIIEAESGAVIYKGLKPGVTRETFAEGIRQGTVDQMLLEVPVSPGECHFLPAGTPHSIGAGLLIAEVQTPSDTTYRVFDWNRVDDSGKSRQLHIEEALDSIHFDASKDNLSVETVGRLVDCPFFKLDKGHQARNGELLLARGQMRVLMILSGSGRICDAQDEVVHFVPGDTLLVPAAYEGAIIFDAETQYLTITV
jgi:mannose-6-phosphate isomerase